MDVLGTDDCYVYVHKVVDDVGTDVMCVMEIGGEEETVEVKRVRLEEKVGAVDVEAIGKLGCIQETDVVSGA